jgi:hypothetical protein
MVKTRKNKSSLINSIRKTSEKSLPIIDNNLRKVGIAAKTMTEKSLPILEKGVSVVYGTMATGFDLGVKGAKSVATGVKKITKRKRVKHHRSKKNRK